MTDKGINLETCEAEEKRLIELVREHRVPFGKLVLTLTFQEGKMVLVDFEKVKDSIKL